MVKDLDNIFAKVMKQNADEVTAQEENSRHVPLMTRICQSRLASFYNIPAVSALLRLFVSVIRVVVMAAVLMSFERVYGSEAMSGLGDESPALAWEGDGSEFATPLQLNRWEVAWMVFGLGTLIDKAQQHFRMVRAKLTYLSRQQLLVDARPHPADALRLQRGTAAGHLLRDHGTRCREPPILRI